MGRFISGDDYISTGQGLLGNNMYTYCLNSPVMYSDDLGNSPTLAVAASAVAISPGALAVCLTVALVIVVISNPEVQSTIARVGSWVDEQKTIITEKMAISLAKANSNESKTHLHHIVAQSDPRALQARLILEYLFECGVNDNRNLVVVDARIHSRLHTNAYFALVNHIIVDAFISAKPYKEAQVKSVTNALNWLKVFIGTLSAI